MYNFCKDNSPVVAVLCIPSDNAKEITDELITLGIKGFWNFSHYDLPRKNENIVVENVHLGDSLMVLAYNVNSLPDEKSH